MSLLLGRGRRTIVSAALFVALTAPLLATDASVAGRTYADGLVELERGDVRRGLMLLEEAARAGLVEAAHELGRRLVAGDAGRLDVDGGIRWLTIAAQRDRVEAQYDLAMALQGRGRVGDHEQGHAWLRAASRVGHPDATFALGVKRLLGEGVAWDSPETFERLRELQRSNNPEATHLLASALAAGRGVPQDIREALRLFRTAIALGDTDARAEMRWVLAALPLSERRRLIERTR